MKIAATKLNRQRSLNVLFNIFLQNYNILTITGDIYESIGGGDSKVPN